MLYSSLLERYDEVDAVDLVDVVDGMDKIDDDSITIGRTITIAN